MKGVQPHYNQGMLNNKVTKSDNFIPVLLLKLQSVTLQVLFRIWGKGAGPGIWRMGILLYYK